MSNETFIVSARKYRPTSFNDLLGQKAVAETLMHEIKNNKLAQAFLFTGPRGVGKTTSARILAKLINTEDGTSEDTDFSFNIFELDAASKGGVDDMRDLIAQVRIPPARGKYKVYIIDEVHMLSTAAFNAFLKTLEEPPSYAIFILATTEKHKVLPTILSRCQVFNFNRIEIADIVKQLRIIAEKEGIKFNEKALFLIAQKADGGMRDALSLFDQLVSFANGEITYAKALELLNILEYEVFFDTITCCLVGDSASALLLLDSVIKRGFDASVFLGGLAAHIRNLIVCKNARTAALIDVSADIQNKYMSQAQEVEMGLLLNMLELVNTADENYTRSNHPRLMVELLLLKLTNLNQLLASIDDLLQLKKKLTSDSTPFEKSKFKVGATEKPIDLKSLETTRLSGINPLETDNTVLIPEPDSQVVFQNSNNTEETVTAVVNENTTETAVQENNTLQDTIEPRQPIPTTIETETTEENTPEQTDTNIAEEKLANTKTEEPTKAVVEIAESNEAINIEQLEKTDFNNIEPKNAAENLIINTQNQQIIDETINKQSPVLHEQPIDSEAKNNTETLIDKTIATETLPKETSTAEKEETETLTVLDLTALWEQFIATLPPKEKAIMEMAELKSEGAQLTATISTGAPLNSFDKTCQEFARFCNELGTTEIKKLQFVKGIIENKNSSPYTDNEKKEYLRNKHPLLAKLMDENQFF